MHRNERALVEVNGEPGGTGERVQDGSQAEHLRGICPKDYKRVIGVLDDGAREVIDERVYEAILTHILHQQAMQELSDSQEEVRGEGIPLSQPILAGDPAPRDTIQQHRSPPSGKGGRHPAPEGASVSTRLKDRVQSLPIDGVKGLLEV
jgi:hypothetical protein